MAYVVDRVVICDAFQEPAKHYQLLTGGRSKLAAGRRPSVRYLASAKDVKGGIGGVVGKEAGLFEDMRIRVATGVAWFYRGGDGGLEYWPDGPDAPSRVHEGDIDNTAIVGDNDGMWHRVRPTGKVEDGMPALTMTSELERRTGGWAIVDGARTIAEVPRERLRVSLSWKALVFKSAAEARLAAEHADDIDLPEVLRRFRDDLAERGVAMPEPADPERDPELIALLQEHYVRYPVGGPVDQKPML